MRHPFSASAGLGFAFLIGVATTPLSLAHASTFVDAANPSLTEIGLLRAGVTYLVTASGIADLLTGFNGGAGATFTADGKPTYAFPAPLEAFNPNGSETDPQTGSFGAAGPGKLLGALVGTFTANPTSYDQVFTIGTSLTVRPALDEVLYAIINDDYYPNNRLTTGYNVSLSTVPLPATLPMFGFALATLGGVGMCLRQARRRLAVTSVDAA